MKSIKVLCVLIGLIVLGCNNTPDTKLEQQKFIVDKQATLIPGYSSMYTIFITSVSSKREHIRMEFYNSRCIEFPKVGDTLILDVDTTEQNFDVMLPKFKHNMEFYCK